MKKSLFLFAEAIVLAFATLWFAACQQDKTDVTNADDQTAVEDRANANSKVYPPSAHPHGKSYAEWSVLWIQEFATLDCESIPFINPANALFYQSGPVYFLAGSITPGSSVNITVPHGKAILFPLITYINDYPCPPEFNHEPAPGQSMEDFLTEGAEAVISTATDLSMEIDGASVNNLASYLLTTELFYFTANPDLVNCLDPCVTGGSQPFVGCGYYMMLKPLSKGAHTVHYTSTLPGLLEQDCTFNITVE